MELLFFKILAIVLAVGVIGLGFAFFVTNRKLKRNEKNDLLKAVEELNRTIRTAKASTDTLKTGFNILQEEVSTVNDNIEVLFQEGFKDISKTAEELGFKKISDKKNGG